MSFDQTSHDAHGLDDSPSLVAGARRLQLSTWQKVGVAGLVAFVFLAFIWVDHALQAKSSEKPPELAMQPNTTAFKPPPLTQGPSIPAAVPAPAPTGAAEMTPAESPLFAFAGGSGAAGPGGGQNPMASLMQNLAAQSVGQPAGQVVPALAAGGQDGSDSILSKLNPTPSRPRSAVLLPHPDMLITKGTIIPCTLQTAINTELAGFVKCVLPEAVRSTTGNVVLLDRGTTVVGEIQEGLQNGQKRVFILWDRAETPAHAIISLASPGSDELGRSGVPGTVNSHFWERFGGALMLSVVDGGLQAGTAAAGRSRGGQASINSFQSSGQSISQSALQSTINIRPTLERKQGSTVSIFVANDIDFSTIYELGVVK